MATLSIYSDYLKIFFFEVSRSVFGLQNPYHTHECETNLHRNHRVIGSVVELSMQFATVKIQDELPQLSGWTETIYYLKKIQNKDLLIYQ